MNSFSFEGIVYVRDCEEARSILEGLKSIVEHVAERQVDCEENAEKYGPGVLRVDICICGECSASTSTRVDATIKRLGDFTVTGAKFEFEAKFETEWEEERGYFFVGAEEQVAEAQSKDAREQILALLPKLRGDDISAVLHSVTKDVKTAGLE